MFFELCQQILKILSMREKLPTKERNPLPPVHVSMILQPLEIRGSVDVPLSADPEELRRPLNSLQQSEILLLCSPFERFGQQLASAPHTILLDELADPLGIG